MHRAKYAASASNDGNSIPGFLSKKSLCGVEAGGRGVSHTTRRGAEGAENKT